MNVHPGKATLGARITDVDLRALDEAAWRAIEAVFHRFGVLVFPEQHLDDAAQVAFSKRFGGLERLVTRRVANPEIGILANVDGRGRIAPPEGKVALFLKGNSYWHTDSSFKPVPAKASLLSARVVPAEGGETEFADMRAALEALDPKTRDELDGLEAVHDYRYSQGLIGGLDVFSDEEWDALPPVTHPIVRTHPATRRENLYIGRHASHVVGRDVAEGRALLARLLEDACQPPRTFTQRWRVGDLVVWDNRCALHRGRPWPPDQARVMHRTTVAGDGANPWSLEGEQPQAR